MRGETTINEARNFLRAKIQARESVPCPCCTRLVSVARRRPHASQVEVLVALFRETLHRNPRLERRPTWIHVENEILRAGLAESRGRDWSVLQHFRLIAPKGATRDPKGSTAGIWSITRAGIEAVQNPRREMIPAWVDTWNGQAWATSPDRISLVQALGRSFDFDQEIRGAVVERPRFSEEARAWA